MQISMYRLEKEFIQILSSNRDQLVLESVSCQSSSSSEFEDVIQSDEDLKKAGASSDLKSIAETMISCGFGKKCIKSYKMIRKSIVLEELHLLGIENCKISRFKRLDWDMIETMIKNWIKASKIGVTTLFRREKLLCDHVFSGLDTIKESCFHEIANEAGINLFSLPEIVASKVKNSPYERIFRLMDLYTAISDLWSEIELIFNFDSVAYVKKLATTSLKKLKSSIHTCLKDFELTIQKDSSKELPSGGGIHKLTKSTMSFISSLSEYSPILSEILAEHHPLKRNICLLESYFTAPILEDEHNNHTISIHLAWLILVLLCKLDIKAQSYNDVSLSYLFLVNNIHFVVNTVRSNHLKNLLGYDWLIKHEAKLRSYATNYEIVAWGNVFLSLPEKKTTTTVLSPHEAKTCFMSFHVAFEEAYMKQSLCVIPDLKLRDDAKASLVKKLVPEYREFYDKYLKILSQDIHMEMLVRFKPDNLEKYISDMFHGREILSVSSSSSSLSSSVSSSSWCCTKLIFTEFAE